MAGAENARGEDIRGEVPVISLATAPGAREAWGRSRAVVYSWAIVELLFVTNPWQISSRLRVAMLNLFGARIAAGVTMRPRIRVKFPWNLTVGPDSWIGEGVWFHNQDKVTVGRDVVISQETMITTGSHAHRRDMALITAPIVIEDGVWVTSRCMVLGGSRIGRSALIGPMTMVSGVVEANAVIAQGPPQHRGRRFPSAGGDDASR